MPEGDRRRRPVEQRRQNRLMVRLNDLEYRELDKAFDRANRQRRIADRPVFVSLSEFVRAAVAEYCARVAEQHHFGGPA